MDCFGGVAGVVRHLLLGVLNRKENPICLPVKPLSDLVEPDAPGNPVEQLNAKLCLQLGNGYAEGRLSNVQIIGRLCHIPDAGYGPKVFQLLQIHKITFPSFDTGQGTFCNSYKLSSYFSIYIGHYIIFGV